MLKPSIPAGVTETRPMLIISVDHEVFGNGSGCLDACVRRPVDRMLSVAEKFSAPLTFFVEALEFEAMQEAGIDGIDSVITQLTLAYKAGHDIQLHIHPQWDGAVYDGKDWRVNEKYWRIGDIDDKRLIRLLKQGKSWLERQLSSDFPEYECLAFRAGGWCIQPSDAVIKALLQLGFQIDSTVAPGLQNLAAGEWADFRDVPDQPYWRTNGDVCREANSGLWEIPILTGKVGRLRHLQAVKKCRSFGSNGMASGCVGSYQGASSRLQAWRGKFGKLMSSGNVMLDFSTMPTDILVQITRDWMAKYRTQSSYLPLVGIAHTKNFTDYSEKNMNEYLQWAIDEGIACSTYRDFLGVVNGR